MDEALILALSRGLERLFIVSAAALCLYFGYALFRKGVLERQVGEVEGAGLKVALTNVGPGVFFALFGALILVASVSQELTLEPPSGDSPGRISSLGGPNDRIDRDVASGIASISRLLALDDGAAPGEIRGTLRGSRPYLAQLRLHLLRQAYSEQAVAEYFDKLPSYQANPAVLDPAVRDRMAAINGLFWPDSADANQ